MCAADLDDVPKFFGFRFEGVAQLFKRRHEAIFKLLRPADVNGGRDHVIT